VHLHTLPQPALCTSEQIRVKRAVYNASTMDTNTLIIIILIVLLLGGGGFFYRGRR
jgi:LPXTG-motif cell wall-anchored protein